MPPAASKPPVSKGYHIVELSTLSLKARGSILERVAKIERKTFPSSEAFDFDAELKKRNTTMMLAIKEGESAELAGYLVYLRMKKVALLHKICVVDAMRKKGVGKSLVHSLRLHLEKGGCHCIQLWVDEARDPARALYQSSGFVQADRCADYYGPGRNGLKMQLVIEK